MIEPSTQRQPREGKAPFSRPPRVPRALPCDVVIIPGPPPAPPARPTMIARTLIALPLVTAGVYLLIAVTTARSAVDLVRGLAYVLIASVSAGFGVWNYRQQQAAERSARREYKNRYTDVINTARKRLEELARLQTMVALENDPPSDTLESIVQGDAAPGALPCPQPRLWERRPGDADFLAVRVGIGSLPPSFEVQRPDQDAYATDRKSTDDLWSEYQQIDDLPRTVPLRSVGSFGIVGPSFRTTPVARALLAQIAVNHDQSEARIGACWMSEDDDLWSWLASLPHTQNLSGDELYRLLARYDRFIVSTVQSRPGQTGELDQVLDELRRELQQRIEHGTRSANLPHLILLANDFQRCSRDDASKIEGLARAGRDYGISVIFQVEELTRLPGVCGAYLDLRNGQQAKPDSAARADGQPSNPVLAFACGEQARKHALVRADSLDLAHCAHLAALLSGVATERSDVRAELPRAARLLHVLDIADARTYDPAAFWGQPLHDAWRPVPCGVLADGAPFIINLNQGMHGFHGIVVGTTGSGKSEFLLTMLLSLAIAHTPDRLQLMLIDFKGGATFSALRGLPHTVGVVTDLGGNETERALVAINSALDRRKERFAHCGVRDIRDYRARGFEERPETEYGPLPNLLMVIDEFDEMVNDYPEVVGELIRVAKQGRSLGVHLLFATQQYSSKIESLSRNLTYWVALRVTSVDDSKSIIQSPEATYLTTETPGRGFFRVNKDVQLFQTALVTTPYQPPVEQSSTVQIDAAGRRVLPSPDRGPDQLRVWFQQACDSLPDGQALIAAFIDRYTELARDRLLPVATWNADKRPMLIARLEDALAGYSARSAEVSASLLSRFCAVMTERRTPESEIAVIVERMRETWNTRSVQRISPPVWLPALSGAIWLSELTPLPAAMSISLGREDHPARALQQDLALDLANNGHLLVVGAQRAGKTTFLQTLILAVARQRTPSETHIYTISALGDGCGVDSRLPHLAATLRSDRIIAVQRLLLHLQATLAERQKGGDSHPVILLIIDHLGALLASLPDIAQSLKELMLAGRACGILVVATAYSQRDAGPLKDTFEQVLALRLANETDVEGLIGRVAARLSPGQRGRAYLRTPGSPIEGQIALPILQIRPRGPDGDSMIDVPSDLAAAVAESVERIGQAQAPRDACWPSPLPEPPEAVRQLAAAPPALCFPIAVNYLTTRPIALDFLNATPHLLIGGPPDAPVSELLNTVLAGIIRNPVDQLQLLLVDYTRDTLAPFARLDHAQWPREERRGGDQPSRTLYASDDEVKALVAMMLADLKQHTALSPSVVRQRRVLVIAGCDYINDASMFDSIAPFLLRARAIGLHLIATGVTFGAFENSKLLKSARNARCAEIQLGHAERTMTVDPRRVPQLPIGDTRPDRGVMIVQGVPALAQFELLSTDDALRFASTSGASPARQSPEEEKAL